MAITASHLRSNIYRLLDQVLETGKPLEIERRGEKLLIVPPQRPDKLSRLTPHADFLTGDPEELVHLDWSDEWRP
jgi:hypothetical protein